MARPGLGRTRGSAGGSAGGFCGSGRSTALLRAVLLEVPSKVGPACLSPILCHLPQPGTGLTPQGLPMAVFTARLPQDRHQALAALTPPNPQ